VGSAPAPRRDARDSRPDRPAICAAAFASHGPLGLGTLGPDLGFVGYSLNGTQSLSTGAPNDVNITVGLRLLLPLLTEPRARRLPRRVGPVKLRHDQGGVQWTHLLASPDRSI
jgi:hypothetical protein